MDLAAIQTGLTAEVARILSGVTAQWDGSPPSWGGTAQIVLTPVSLRAIGRDEIRQVVDEGAGTLSVRVYGPRVFTVQFQGVSDTALLGTGVLTHLQDLQAAFMQCPETCFNLAALDLGVGTTSAITIGPSICDCDGNRQSTAQFEVAFNAHVSYECGTVPFADDFEVTNEIADPPEIITTVEPPY